MMSYVPREPPFEKELDNFLHYVYCQFLSQSSSHFRHSLSLMKSVSEFLCAAVACAFYAIHLVFRHGKQTFFFTQHSTTEGVSLGSLQHARRVWLWP